MSEIQSTILSPVGRSSMVISPLSFPESEIISEETTTNFYDSQGSSDCPLTHVSKEVEDTLSSTGGRVPDEQGTSDPDGEESFLFLGLGPGAQGQG